MLPIVLFGQWQWAGIYLNMASLMHFYAIDRVPQLPYVLEDP